MSDISKINPNGTEYNLKDATARAGIESSKTVTGNPITVNDAAPINAEDITVDIMPQQDLHGYDRPWVGGAGANKWDEEWRNGYYQLNTQASDYGQFVSFAGAVANKNPISVLPSTKYTMCVVSGGRGSIFFYDSNHDVISHTLFYVSPFSFTTPANCAYINFNMDARPYGATYKNDIALNYPSAVTTYSPYSNICPITGWTGAELTQKDAATNPTVTRTYTANFGETVYGGKWHVTEGGTDKTHASVEYDGRDNEIWSMSSGTGYHQFMISRSSVKDTLNALTNYFQSINISERGFKTGLVKYTDTNIRIALKDSELLIESVEDWKTWLSNHNLQLCYELATPTPISTPKQNVPMLKGINTVSADCGDTSLKYQPDNVIGELKGEIEDNIIYEDYKWTTESSQSYSAGTPGTYGTSSWRDVKKEGYDVIGVTFVENRRFGDCILTLCYIPSTNHVEVIIFRATSSAVTIADEDIEYRVAYKKA